MFRKKPLSPEKIASRDTLRWRGAALVAGGLIACASALGVEVTDTPHLTGEVCRDIDALSTADNRIDPLQPTCLQIEDALYSGAAVTGIVIAPAALLLGVGMLIAGRRPGQQ